MAKIRILLTDDHTLFRQGIKTLIAAETDMEVVGEAANGTDAVTRAAETRPDIVLMDIGMTGLSSFEATRQIKKNRPETKVLFLTMYDDEDYLVECMQVGAGGYVLKEPAYALAIGGRFPIPREIHAAHASFRHAHHAREGSAQGAGGRQLGEGDRRRIESQREDCGSAQIQSHAQVGYSQQSSTGAVRDPEEDHPDSLSNIGLIRRRGAGLIACSAFRPEKQPSGAG